MSTSSPGPRDRTLVWAQATAALTAFLYVLVGFEIVKVKGVAEVEPGPAIPLVIAAIAFAALSVLLVVRPGRAVFVSGVLLCLVVLVGYFVVAPNRSPSFEVWGLAIKAVELVAVAALGRLAVRKDAAADAAHHVAASRTDLVGAASSHRGAPR